MKKSEIRSIMQVLEILPFKECEDRELKIQLVHDMMTLKRFDQEILSDVASLRTTLIGDKQAKVDEYFSLQSSGKEEESRAMVDEVKDVILDFNKAYDELLKQDVDVNLPYKVDGGKLVEFIVDHAPEALDKVELLISIIK